MTATDTTRITTMIPMIAARLRNGNRNFGMLLGVTRCYRIMCASSAHTAHFVMREPLGLPQCKETLVTAF